MNIILHQPEIPGNTGNIGRTCVATGTPLHLIEPLGFHLDEKSIRRAGMDYWQQLELHRYVNFEQFCAQHPGAKIWMATTKAKKCYTEVEYGPDDFIMFGKESAGIPEELLVENEANCIRIPMLPQIRSLNLSNSVSIVLYEALRQNGFGGLAQQGELHRLHWKNVFVAPDATVTGDVSLEDGASVWHHATVRGDRASVVIGRGSNIQDNCVVHVGLGYPVEIGQNVTVGHGAIVHGCTIGDNTLIGMGAILMNGCRIGKDCIIGAGALVTEGKEIPDGSLVVGSPGKIVRQVTQEELQRSLENAALYVKEAAAHLNLNE